MKPCGLFVSREGEGMEHGRGGVGPEELFEAPEEWGTRLEGQDVRLEERGMTLGKFVGRLAAELSGSAGAVGFFDN
jgi:hypothetical protein